MNMENTKQGPDYRLRWQLLGVVLWVVAATAAAVASALDRHGLTLTPLIIIVGLVGLACFLFGK
jgi:hypothetical protein